MSVYHPLVKLPAHYEVFDFSKGYDPGMMRDRYIIGRYNEKRAGVYTNDLFTSEVQRDIHMGLDIGAPAGTPVYAFDDGEIFMTALRPASGDYGGTLISQHRFNGRDLYALHGHLAHASLEGRSPGQSFSKGDVLGWIGNESENGGWNPHVHFQLSWAKPEVCDLPGVVSESQRAQALLIYPDPRLVLGKLYSDEATDETLADAVESLRKM